MAFIVTIPFWSLEQRVIEVNIRGRGNDKLHCLSAILTHNLYMQEEKKNDIDVLGDAPGIPAARHEILLAAVPGRAALVPQYPDVGLLAGLDVGGGGVGACAPGRPAVGEGDARGGLVGAVGLPGRAVAGEEVEARDVLGEEGLERRDGAADDGEVDLDARPGADWDGEDCECEWV